MARVGATFFTFGSTLGLVALAVIPNISTPAVIELLIATGYTIAAILFFGSERLPSWVFTLVPALGTVLVSCAVYVQHITNNEMLYLLPALYGFYFLTRRQAAVQAGIMAASYAAVIALRGWPSPVIRWTITVSSLVAAGLVVNRLRSHLEQTIAQLSDAARTDPLTGLLNRRGFSEVMQGELERARRGDTPVSLVACDLDHFKRFNDAFGHPEGDLALALVGELLQGFDRRADTAARIGGEEFALILPDTDERGAYMVAERLRAEVAAAFCEMHSTLTMSVGVASYPESAGDVEGLIQASDRALYAAKKLGRDRTVTYSREIPGLVDQFSAVGDREGDTQLASVLMLAEALDVRHMGTARHSRTVARHAQLMARELELDAETVERIRLAGLVHDVGKIGVSDAILLKPGPLNEQEWVEMRKHPEIGARLLGTGNLDIREAVLAHHERPDGRGYPKGLRGDEISLGARILAVADAYEAMTADRIYRAALGHEAAREELQRAAGTQFDRHVVDAFLVALDREPPHRMRAHDPLLETVS